MFAFQNLNIPLIAHYDYVSALIALYSIWSRDVDFGNDEKMRIHFYLIY